MVEAIQQRDADTDWVVVFYTSESYQTPLEYRYSKLPETTQMDNLIFEVTKELLREHPVENIPQEGCTLYFAVQEPDGHLHKGSIHFKKNPNDTWDFSTHWLELYCESLMGCRNQPGKVQQESCGCTTPQRS